MPSVSLGNWQTRSARVLDEIEAAHAAVGGGGPGGRFAAQQVNHAYVVMLCSQFQRFCRDLHTEAATLLTAHQGVRPDPRLTMLRELLTEGRKLDSGNPNPGNLGSDYWRFELDLWDAVRQLNPRNARLQRRLDELCTFRNAVAHQDFNSPRLGGRRSVRLADVRRWRRACDDLAVVFDRVLGIRVAAIIGTNPW